jgi:DNA-binding MarR family transcriptional regulator
MERRGIRSIGRLPGETAPVPEYRKSRGVAQLAPREPADRLPNALAFLRLLWAIDHGLRSVSRQMHGKLGMTGPQRLVLRMVGKFPDLMPSELATLLHLDRGTLTGIVERLSSQQLLSRKANEKDGRSFLLRLTARGQLLDREVPGTVEACIQRALAALPRAKVEAAKLVLEAVARELAKDAELAASPDD